MKWLAIILTVLFTVFELLGIITWSWWVVFLPSIIYFALALILIIVLALIKALSGF